MTVWDLPTRIYHWLQVVFVIALMYTGTTEQGPHTKIGLALLTLLIWRVIWGFVGSETSRFHQFLKSPAKVLTYIRGSNNETIGHNPAGGYMVILMIFILSLQCITGLALAGYLDPLPGSETWLNDDIFDYAVAIHENGITLLYLLIGAHLSAIAIYKMNKKPLILTMITGVKDITAKPITIVSNQRATTVFILSLIFTISLYMLSLE